MVRNCLDVNLFMKMEQRRKCKRIRYIIMEDVITLMDPKGQIFSFLLLFLFWIFFCLKKIFVLSCFIKFCGLFWQTICLKSWFKRRENSFFSFLPHVMSLIKTAFWCVSCGAYDFFSNLDCYFRLSFCNL